MILLLFLLFVGRMVHSCGKVILLRGNSYSTIANVSERKYVCLSEDDGGALVWNDIYANFTGEKKEKFKFHSINVDNDTWINCKMNANMSCLESWSRVNWTLTNSVRTPMGPVFDQRWEDFKELRTRNYEDPSFRHVIRGLLSVGAMSFSVRSMKSLQFMICDRLPEASVSNNELCFWTTINSINSTQASVTFCQANKIKFDLEQCSYFAIRKIHMPLFANGWQTFVASWNLSKGRRNISVYDVEDSIFTFEDEKEVSSLFNVTDISFIGVPDTYRNITKPGYLRFHLYKFLFTTDETAVLTSPVFKRNTQKICIQLLMGLCAKCDADVVMIDFITNEILKSITAKGSMNAAIHGLPMWQLIKLDGDFSAVNYSGSVQIQVIPKLTASDHNSLWAIADVRQCPSKEVLRKSSILATTTYVWKDVPELTCQSLFYDKNIIVRSQSKAINNIDLDNKNCPEGRIGPGCLFSCKHDLNNLSDCAGITICYKNGCTCSAGYQGDTCSDLCDNNWYGYNCKNKCGLCKSFDYKDGCNKVTGECINGCLNSSKMIYVPPLCCIGMEPRAPVIVSATSTSIRTVVYIVWKEECKHVIVNYSFTIKGEDNYILSQPWNRLFQNMTILMKYFDQLNPGSIYYVKYTFLVENKTFDSEWQIVETDCEPAPLFNILSMENGVFVDRQITSDQLLPCPPRWYYLRLKNRNTGKSIYYARILKFPYEVSSLQPYIFFNVIVLHPQNISDQKNTVTKDTVIKHTVLVDTHIRTLQSVTTGGLNIQYFMNSSTQVTFTWKSLNHLNTVTYVIILKVNLYYGCEDLNKNSTVPPIIKKDTNKTTITIPDLHPYASYTAQLTAHESADSSYNTEITFNTPKSDIPAEVFTQLKVENWTLSWQPPKDCSTISGPLMARIKINGVSPTVQYFTAIEVTSRMYLDLTTINQSLLSAEQYRARVYVIREYNGTENYSAYQELFFKTSSTAPSTIKNLEVIEVDTRQKLSNMMLHLRWLNRFSPVKRQFHYYNVTSCNFIKVEENNLCDLWDDHICANISLHKNCSNIKIFELNENGTEVSPPTIVHQEMFTTTKPEKPASIIYKLNNNSVIDLVWYHPWKTNRHLQCFLIEVKEDISYLKKRTLQSTMKKPLEYPVEEYKRNYTERLYLFPSTFYRIYIRSVTITNETSLYNYINVQTPSTASFFDNILRVVPNEFNSTISLNIPHVLNDTYDSVIHIIVKGPNRCKNYSSVPVILQKQANIKTYDAWQAAEISTDEIARNNFTFIVGDNKTYGSTRNCPLQLNQPYKIIVILTEQSSVFRISNKAILFRTSIIEKVPDFSQHYKMWLVLLMLPLIFVLIRKFAIYHINQRKKKKDIKIAWSKNEFDEFTKSEEGTVFDKKTDNVAEREN